jgi:ATP-dependent Clp protease ATP-binding subunit ClpA
MLTLLEKPQPRQKLIDEYIQTYNQFLDDNLDMIEDPETKMEMHQRVEDLCGKLIELVEDLQKISLTKREAIMKSGWAEYQLESLLTYAQSLMQAEVNRYRAFNRFAEDFYSTKDSRPMVELTEETLFDTIVDSNTLPPVEYEGEDCQRLDFLYQSAMGVVTGEMPVAAKDVKGRKEAKKEVKKLSKKEAKKKEEEAVVEENKELTALVEAEKSILKYRLGMIKEWTERRVKEIRGICKLLYDRLVDWIRMTIKCQREAINQLSMRLREAIEEERKIQKEIRMKSFDLIMDEKFLYFIIPPPKLLPGIEAVLDSRFSIAQLVNLLQNLKLITKPNGFIDLGLLISLLTKQTVTSITTA